MYAQLLLTNFQLSDPGLWKITNTVFFAYRIKGDNQCLSCFHYTGCLLRFATSNSEWRETNSASLAFLTLVRTRREHLLHVEI